jgi:hypothetical protein
MHAEDRVQAGFSDVGAGCGDEGGNDMAVLDVLILVTIAALAVFFAGVAVAEWLETRRRSGAQVIQHQHHSESKVFPAA